MSTGVVVDFNANLARFTSGVDKAIADLNKFQSNADRISGNISRAFGALGIGIGVGAFAALIKGSIDAQDHLLDLSKTTRLSVEDLAGLSSAAQKSGSDLDGTAKAINKLAVEMGKDGEKFKALGITAKDPLVAFGQLSDVMNAIDDPQKRAAVGATALGKSWADAAPLMAEGGKGIRDLIELGKAHSKVTTESAKRADEFNDKLTNLKGIAGGWVTAVANPIVSGLLKINNALSLEVNRKPGSIAEFLMGPDRGYGYKGPRDALGLPALGAKPEEAKPPGKPTLKAIDKFIGGDKGNKAKTDLERMLDAQKKRIAELNALAGDEQMVSVDSVSRQYDTKAAADNLQRLNALLAATPTGQLQKAREEMQFLAAALETGAINEAQFAEAVGVHYGKASEALDQMSEFAVEAARGIQAAFAEFLFDPFDDKTDSMLEKFGTMLRKMAAQAAAAQLNEIIFGDLAKSGKLGGLAGSLAASLFGGFGDTAGVAAGVPQYAQGTPWVPNDGLAFLHKGEQVIPAGKSGGSMNVTIVNNSRAQITQKESSGDGKRELVVMIEDVVNGLMGGGGLDGAMRQNFGARRVGVLRG